MKNESAISLVEIRELGTALPPPIAKRVIGGIQFEVYRAKSLFRDEWESDALRKLVVASRTSYQRWGDFRPLDRDDGKAVVYLVRLDYPHREKLDGAMIEEWVSYRFVPASGDPPDVEELSLFVCDGKPVMEAAREIRLPGFHREQFAALRYPPLFPRRRIRKVFGLLAAETCGRCAGLCCHQRIVPR
jgi:hypothetical protein